MNHDQLDQQQRDERWALRLLRLGIVTPQTAPVLERVHDHQLHDEAKRRKNQDLVESLMPLTGDWTRGIHAAPLTRRYKRITGNICKSLNESHPGKIAGGDDSSCPPPPSGGTGVGPDTAGPSDTSGSGPAAPGVPIPAPAGAGSAMIAGVAGALGAAGCGTGND